MTDSGGVAHVHCGESVNLALPANPSTGLRWQLDRIDTRISVVQNCFVSEGAESHGPGTRLLQLLAVAPGEAHVEFGLRRSWEKLGASVKHFSVTILIENDSRLA
jgi:predicted secreted protein